MENKEIDENIKQLIKIVKELNWTLAFPAGGGSEDDGKLHGMIIGEDSYVKYVIKHLL